MLEATTIDIAIECDWRQLYEAFWRPEAFPRWASGLSDASLIQVGGEWKAKGPGGTVSIVFTQHNPYGVMDHWVVVGAGATIYVPLRVVENGEGAQVALTLFRQPGMSEAAFAEDADAVRRDLARLKTLAESR